ncbi:MAG: hypothetical protein FWG93_04580 [Oscillospiraceae bacterium]|nr:hypothetical protein [Oscillospiraceae bacterium]
MTGREIIDYAVRAEMPDMEKLREHCIRRAGREGGQKNTLTEGMKMTVQRRKAARTVLTAAVLAAVLATGVLAAGNVIYRFVAGESSEAKDKIMSMSEWNNIALIIGSAEISMDEYYAPHTNFAADGDGWRHFSTVEEAGLFSRFAFKSPSRLPEEIALLNASVITDGDGLPGYTVLLSYDGNMALCMDYVGDNAYLDVREAGGGAMRRVMIGGTEGVAVSRDADLWTLIWMENGIVYRLEKHYYHSESDHFGSGLDTLIAIAESL